MTHPRPRPPWVSALAGLGAIMLVTGSIAGLVLTRDSRSDPPEVATLPAAGPGACGPPAERPFLDPPGPTPPPPAPVAIPGATEVDLRGLAVTEVVAGGGQAWASVVEPARDPTVASGRLARIDAASGALVGMIPVVERCSISALAIGEGGVWVGTCDELAASDADGGGLVVRVDPATGAVAGQSPVPASCVAGVTAGSGSVSASSHALAGEAAQVWRVDPITGAVTETEQLVEDALGGIAVTDDGVWVQELGGDGDEAVRSDAETGAEETSVPEEEAVLIGGAGDAVWFQRPGAIVQRDAATGAVRTETPLGDVQTAAIGQSGVWFQQATRGSLTITIGRIDPVTGAVTHTFGFAGVDLDRTGLPFPVRLAVDETGVWIVYQGRLFRAPLPGAPAPEAAPPPTSAPPTSAPTTTTTAPASTSVPASSTVPTPATS